MDPSIVTSVVLVISSTLLAINAFFLRGLVRKIDNSDMLSNTNSTKMEMVISQMSSNAKDFNEMSRHLSNVDRDVAVLKFAILKKLGISDDH